MKLHLWLPAVAALITTPPRHRAITQQRAALTPPSLEAASFDALGGNIVLQALQRRCVGRRAQRYFAAYNATLAADYAETLAAHDASEKLEPFLGRDVADDVLEAAKSGASVTADDLAAAADATASINEAAAWAAEADTQLPTASLLAAAPATRSFEADAFERDEHGCMTTALADTPALAEARHAVTKARARLAAAVASERAEHDGLFELEKDRFVVPVKTATPPKALGRKRGASRSGRSSYVEPHGCAAAADAVEEALSALEIAENQRLAELTAQLAKTADSLRTALDAVAALDAARARALCGFDDLQGVVPESGACLDLVGARDPTLLLDATVDSVVPIDVIAAKGGAVVVSGPNGGGKTSLLRTVGLAAILTRLGVPVPAARAAVPAYQCVLADVDGAARTAFPQRSTYEARCRTLAAALAADDVLALLDELGGATDVAEGAAVATAALDALCDQGATTVCATHVAALKALPARDSRYVSLAFRVDEAGRPTFSPRPGAPGKADALAAAARSGLPDAVVRRAEELLVAETPAAPADANADALWSALDAARAEAADAAQAAADEREQLGEERAALRAAVADATDRASRRARMAATRLEKREAKLEGMFRELNKLEYDAKRVVGATLDAARLENKEGRTDAVAAVLASHGLASIPPGKDVKVGDDLLHVAGVDVEAGTVRVLAGVVASIDLDVVSFELPDGTVLEKIPRSSLAKWDVPYLADGTEVLAPAAAPSVSSARGRRHARYR
jgi:dsDNA-specific endonuclease/ATPase MutS2